MTGAGCGSYAGGGGWCSGGGGCSGCGSYAAGGGSYAGGGGWCSGCGSWCGWWWFVCGRGWLVFGLRFVCGWWWFVCGRGWLVFGWWWGCGFVWGCWALGGWGCVELAGWYLVGVGWWRGDRLAGELGHSQVLRLEGLPGPELGAAGQPSPERDDLLGRRLPAPRREQELLGEGPQVDRVGFAPGQGVARQCERGTEREHGVGPRGGDARAGDIEGPQFLPAPRRLQELRRDAAQRVLGPGEVVGPHRDDHGRLVRGRARGMADDLGVGHRVLGHCALRHRVLRRRVLKGRVLRDCVPGRLALEHRVPRHGVRSQSFEMAVVVIDDRARRTRGLEQFVVGDVGGHRGNSQVFVTGLPVESRGLDVAPVDQTGFLVAGGRATLTQVRHQQPQAAQPGEQEDHRDDVDDGAGRVGPVADVGAGFGPFRWQGQFGCAEQQERGGRDAHSHEAEERVQLGRLE